MKRPLLTWIVFAACTLTGLGVLGWFSAEMLRLERGAAQAREIAAREESVRLALWRMDSALASIHGLEAARPVHEYEPFVRVEPVFDESLHPLSGTPLTPSPLLGYTPPFVHLHVEVRTDGTYTSPQVPDRAVPATADRAGLDPGELNAAAARLRRLLAMVPPARVLAALDSPAAAALAEDAVGSFDARNESPAAPAPSAGQALDAEIVAQEIAQPARRQAETELRKNVAEQQQRATLSDENYYVMNRAPDQRARSMPVQGTEGLAADGDSAAPGAAPGEVDLMAKGEVTASAPSVGAAAPAFAASPARTKADTFGAEPSVGPLQSAWINGELFLLRSVTGDARVRAQAVWLDWPELRAWLLSRVADLLPDAALEPITASPALTGDEASRRLAFLPVRLRPGAIVSAAASSWSPLQVSLAIAWVLAGVGVVALALLLAGTLRLSERRGAFVSAVTHELRTPLTTFRMYTEMLSSGMVPDEAKRRSYLDTLRKEAERLSHLVENVLSYARLERGRASRRIEDTTPGALFARMEERLRLRAEQGGLALSIAFDPGADQLPLRTDTTAFEQIVFNLVDNAAKYARRPDGGGALAISIAAGARGRVVVRVADNGPGIAASVRKRLFQPFSKSAAEAAHSQPGVGLGLALSRRLARDELHGELALERTGPEGTVFRLGV